MKNLLKYALAATTALFAISCDNQEQTPEPAPEPTPITVELTSNKSTITLGESFDLTVMVNNEDKSADAQIFLEADNTEIKDATFTPSEAGTYNLFAQYEQTKSNTIKLTCIEPTLSAANDSAPTKFDGFEHKVLAVMSTGLDCTSCPHMIKALDMFKSEYPTEAENFIVATSHAYSPSDPMYNDVSTSITKLLEPESFPSVCVAFASTFGNTGTADSNLGTIRSAYQNYISTPAITNISANSKIDGEQLLLRVDVKSTQKTSLFLTAFLVEDGVEGKQLGADQYPDLDMTIHNSAIIGSISTKTLYDDFSQKSEVEGGYILTYNGAISFENMINDNKENCRMVVAVYDLKQSCVDNAITFKVGESYDFRYE